MRHLLRPLALLLLVVNVVTAQPADTVRIGTKNFTEQEILGELVAQLLETYTDLTVDRSRFGLGGTGLCHTALIQDELDLYVEYTGTALLDILGHHGLAGSDDVFQAVAQAYRDRFDVEWLPPIGFNSTYAIAVRSDDAKQHGWTRISDLKDAATHLRAGFTSEFMERPDGYPGLSRRYELRFQEAFDMDPGLMYQALAEKQVDVICAFSTDGRVAAYNFTILKDDQSFFPPYDAAPVVRGRLLDQHPEIRTALAPLAGTIDDQTMQQLSYAVTERGVAVPDVVRQWIESRRTGAGRVSPSAPSIERAKSNGFRAMLYRHRHALVRKTIEHLDLTGRAMLIAICLGVPLGVVIHRYRSSSPFVLGVAEIMQTIPSLAMLAFLFAVYGILGTTPAVTALVLYALLPIVLNTFTGLKEVRPQVIEAADGVGMSSWQRLWMVELPLALPVIVAGIRTATVWTVGIATLSTYIGAGGLGDFISRGLARNDTNLTLLGAVPAAIMAVMLSLLIRTIERWLRGA